MLAEINRDSKKKPKPFKPEDFMPHEKEEPHVMSDDDMRQQMGLITKMLGGKEV